MSEHIYACSDDRLWSLLQSDDDNDEMQESARHVDRCSRCQARLEKLAAKPDEWRIAKDSLQSDIETGEPFLDRSRWLRYRGQRSPASWTESIAGQLLAPPSHPEMLGRIGRYEVERFIGSGGMGVVFKAFDTELNRPVAVKVLAPYLADSGAARKRFAREARAAAAVVHEHVVAIHNVESDGAAAFLVMQFVSGESLQQRIDREGPIELCKTLRIARQTAAGLAAAHAQGLVHRDVKPSNILLEQGVERALLTDFGLARASDDASLTHTGYHPGTPQYMSPEQARGDAVDTRSDLFSLGSVLYTMCTGRPPFRAETSYGILRRITDNEPRSIREINPAIPDWFERIVARLHAKAPGQRFQSAEELAVLLEQCLAHVQQPTTVRLPASLQAGAFVTAKSFLARWLRSPSGGPIIRGVIGMTMVTLVVAASILASVSFFRNIGQTKVSAPDQSGAAQDQAKTTAPKNADPATSWELTTDEITSYANDFAPFEARSQQLWNDDPKLIKE